MKNDVMVAKQLRNTSFEILRIIAMFIIVAHNFAYHGGFLFDVLEQTPTMLINWTWYNLLVQSGEACVNLFILISGFFLVTDKGFRSKRWLYVVFQTLIFSLIFGFTFLFVNNEEITYKGVIGILFPIGSQSWWFITTYLLLYLIHPLLNYCINAINKKLHLLFIIIFLTIWSIVPTFLNVGYGITYIGWFVTLYFIAGYIRIYDIKFKFKPWIGILISILLFVGVLLLRYFVIIGLDLSNEFYYLLFIWTGLGLIFNFIQVLCSITIFICFKEIKVKTNKFVNYIASFTLAIYLFHEQPGVRKYLYGTLIRGMDFADKAYFIPFTLGVISAIFLAGLIIGIVYKYTIGLGVKKLLDKLDEKFLYRIDNLFE